MCPNNGEGGCEVTVRYSASAPPVIEIRICPGYYAPRSESMTERHGDLDKILHSFWRA
jgi:hypothetical protein